MSVVQHNFFLDSKQANIWSNDGSTASFFINGGLDLNKQDMFLSLLSCNIVFNEPNITSSNNMFYWVDNDAIEHSYQFERGLYSIQEINDELQQLFIDIHGVESARQFQFTADTSTGKCKVQFRDFDGWKLDCTKANNILSILGFTSSQGLLETTGFNQYVDSESRIKLNTLRNYIVTCNLVSDSYLNGNRGDAIALFTPNIEPNSQYTYEPLHLSHLPLNVNTIINKIMISFLNQDLKPCDFTGGTGISADRESWTVRLRLSNVLLN